MADENNTQEIEVTTLEPAADEGAQVQSEQPAEQVAKTEPEAPAAELEPEAKKDETKIPAWTEKRLAEITRQRHDAERRAQALESELAIYRQGTQPAPDGQPQPPQQPSADPYAIAQQIADERVFNEKCNGIYEDGKKAFPDFDNALRTYQAIGGFNQNFIEAAMETGKSAQVLYELGKNPDEAMRIMALSPVKMGIELSRMADKIGKTVAAKPISQVPPPITPVDGAARVSDAPSDADDDATWIAKRNAQLAARKR